MVDEGSQHWFARLVGSLRRFTGPALAAAALVFGAAGALGAMPVVGALMTFLCVSVILLLPWWLRDNGTPRLATAPGLRSDQSVIRAVIGHLSDPTILLDRNGRVLYLNALAQKLAPALRIGEPALFARRSPEVVAALRRALASSEPQRADYVEYVPVDRWMELIVTPLEARESGLGVEQYVLLSFRDQTPLRRAEEMRADFVANASHELRTPLAALSGFIDTLQGPARNDEAARVRFLSIMQAQATRMARLIDDLLSLSRIELSAHIHPETSVDVVGIVRQVIDGLESLARERHVTVSVETKESAISCPGNRDELLRLFENLIENALKYGATGGRVVVSFTHAVGPDGEREIRVSVRDFGPGIAPEHLPRLTERFYRVDVGESRTQGGTGLGLSLVKHTLNRHRGRLMIESVPGQGATFTACLPQIAQSTGVH